MRPDATSRVRAFFGGLVAVEIAVECFCESVSGAAWSPDGRWIAYTHSGGIWLIEPNGTNSHRIAHPGGLPCHQCGWAPAQDLEWSPDGHKLALMMHNSAVILSLHTGSMRRIARLPWSTVGLTWQPVT